ncbi:MAG: hypothetical protein FWE19_03775 [Oscillospiraceae bacterium]|nr:hypothetical protein [Oscillospiraceae bacterium]
MEQQVYLAATAWTLIPIILTIACVFLTKRILLSMTVGIISSSFMVSNFNLFGTVRTIERTIMTIFFTGPTQVQGAGDALVDVMIHPNAHATQLFGFASRWYFSIIIFLLGLGIITAFVVITGGSRAFVQSVSKKVKTRKGVQFITVIIGIVLMIDDYFNAMVNGNIGKTMAGQHKLSRARVTYNVDSIAAPICIAAPVSSWAVAIMGNIGRVYEEIGHEGNLMLDFVRMIPYHFYVFAAIGMVLITIIFDFNMFSMKKYEAQTAKGEADESAHDDSVGLELADVESKIGTVWDFWLPIICLVVATVGTMVTTGLQAAPAEQIIEYSLTYSIMDNMSLSMSLLLGGIAGGVSALYLGLRHVKAGEVTKAQYNKAVWAGMKSMRTAIGILCLSWILSSLISRLDVGTFFANVIQDAGIYSGFVPLIMFLTAAVMAFCIGTSWGTFAIVLPIAGAVAYAIDISLLLPAMSAVLSGAVFGDHSSPISDTTVLSSAGASCKVVDHFQSQLPYAILAALMASVGYLAFGLSRNVFVGYIGFGIAVAAVVVFVSIKTKSQRAA